MSSFPRALLAISLLALSPALSTPAAAAGSTPASGPMPLFVLPPETRVALTRSTETPPFDFPEGAPAAKAPVTSRTTPVPSNTLPPFQL